MLSDIDGDADAMAMADADGDCQLKLACLVSDTVRLIVIFIIILQVRESASSQRSQE